MISTGWEAQELGSIPSMCFAAWSQQLSTKAAHTPSGGTGERTGLKILRSKGSYRFNSGLRHNMEGTQRPKGADCKSVSYCFHWFESVSSIKLNLNMDLFFIWRSTQVAEGSPAKGVGPSRGARVQIPPSPIYTMMYRQVGPLAPVGQSARLITGRSGVRSLKAHIQRGVVQWQNAGLQSREMRFKSFHSCPMIPTQLSCPTQNQSKRITWKKRRQQ